MKEVLQIAINGRVRELLKLQGRNQEWLSSEAEIDKAQLSEILNCRNNKRWDNQKIERVAQALQVPAWQILVDPKAILDDFDAELVSRYHSSSEKTKIAINKLLNLSDGQ